MKNISLIIKPNLNIYYYSYYLFALEQNKYRFEFKNNIFPDFHDHCFAYKINYGKLKRNIYISAGDGTGFNRLALDWCDVYAKINIDKSKIPNKYSNKIMALGPSFGIKYLNWVRSVQQCLITFNKSNINFFESRNHFANYYRQWKYRNSFALYSKVEADENYIFHASTLWRKELTTNQHRANFMQECIANTNVNFEGGFAPGKETYFPKYKSLFLKKKYSHFQYLENIKKSFVVFNTPAVQNCFGWKLAEYLAMGKAIISTPINNLLPSPLVNGKHIHFVDGTEKSINNAINLIQSDIDYRRLLERNSRDYFFKYLSPKSIIDRINKFANLY